MAQTGQQRQEAYEKRLKESGGRIVKVALEAETAKWLDEIKALTGMKTNKAVVKHAIMALRVKVKEMDEAGKFNRKDVNDGKP